MNRKKAALAAAALVLSTLVARASGEAIEYRYHLLMHRDDGVFVEPVVVTSAQRVTRTHRPEDGVLDVLVPVGPGGSGSLIKAGSVESFTVECADGAITVTALGVDGRKFARPSRTLDDLAQYDVRVSVSGGGVKRAFLLLRNEEVVSDDAGGIVDPFSGKLPLGAGDFVVFTDTNPHAARTTVTGEAPLDLDSWPFAMVSVCGRKPVPFVVDTGAGTTVIVKDALPDGVAISKPSMIEWSAAGKRLLDYAPEGATGSVGSIEGIASVASLALGTLDFRAAECDVIGALPKFAGRKVGGILGLDLLRRARVVTLALSGEHPKLVLAAEPEAASGPSSGATNTAPFSLVRTHVVVEGTIASKTVRFVLDTGAPDSILDGAAAKSLGLASDKARGVNVSGLDGGSASLVPVDVAELSVAGARFVAPPFRAGDLAIFAPVRGDGQLAGLLGSSFVARCAKLELDFEERTVRLFAR